MCVCSDTATLNHKAGGCCTKTATVIGVCFWTAAIPKKEQCLEGGTCSGQGLIKAQLSKIVFATCSLMFQFYTYMLLHSAGINNLYFLKQNYTYLQSRHPGTAHLTSADILSWLASGPRLPAALIDWAMMMSLPCMHQLQHC